MRRGSISISYFEKEEACHTLRKRKNVILSERGSMSYFERILERGSISYFEKEEAVDGLP